MWRALLTGMAMMAAGTAAAAGNPPPCGSRPALGLYADSLARTAGPAALLRRHQLRSWRAMWELACAVPMARRPRAILYPASGVHLAPLVLCEALPAEVPCRLDLTDVDSRVMGPLGDLLGVLHERGVVRGLHRLPAGEMGWRFRLSGHPVRLHVILRGSPSEAPPPLLTPELLAGHDLVVSHDWSGDPVGNLRVVLWHLEAARSLPASEAPMLMIEDLGAHPFPVDLGLFGVVAATGQDYGHRAPPAGVGGHAAIELGNPIFGGAVLLGFQDSWWSRVSEEDLEAVLDLLVFSRFGWERRNVLVPGHPPRCAPELLDWWTGFGGRTVTGEAEPLSAGFVRRMVEAAVRASAVMEAATRRILCRHLDGLGASLQRTAAGEPERLPALESVPPAELPPVARREWEVGRARSALRRAERVEARRRARRALEVFREPAVEDLLQTYRCAEPDDPRSENPRQ